MNIRDKIKECKKNNIEDWDDPYAAVACAFEEHEIDLMMYGELQDLVKLAYIMIKKR